MSTSIASIKAFSQYEFSSVVEAPIESNLNNLEETIKCLKKGAHSFAALSIDERIKLIDSMQKGYLSVAKRSVQAGCTAKGIEIGTPTEGEEWATGSLCVIRHLRLLKESLKQIQETGNTQVKKINRLANNQLSLPVFPGNIIDGLLFKDVRVDVHMQKGLTEKDLETSRAAFYKNPNHEGKLVFVLGAGNIAAIPSMDVLTKMFNEGKVCILKMNPVNAYLGSFIEEAFKEVIGKNYLAVVYGGVEVGQFLVNHEDIDEIHITGSDKTHDAIIWGAPGPERVERMAKNNPACIKHISSELGNISPVIIYPGEYTHKQLAFQAEDLAASFSCNSAFLCCVPVSVITWKAWKQRDKFLELLEEKLSQLESRKAYYPGAKERWHSITASRDNIKNFGDLNKDSTPWSLITGLSDDDQGESIYHEEPFCSVLAETTIEADNGPSFLRQAVNFANNRLWGTLTASLIVDPKSQKNHEISNSIEEAISNLHYGTVTVNASFSSMSFVFASPPWGAYPGSSLNDIQSGRGWVHNTKMLEGIEKTVARFPITSFPKPVYFPSHRTAHKMAPKLVELEMEQSWSWVPAIVFNAMMG